MSQTDVRRRVEVAVWEERFAAAVADTVEDGRSEVGNAEAVIGTPATLMSR